MDKKRGLNPSKTLEGLRVDGYLLIVEEEKRRRLEEKERLRRLLPPMASAAAAASANAVRYDIIRYALERICDIFLSFCNGYALERVGSTQSHNGPDPGP